jgi:hypothetical protein
MNKPKRVKFIGYKSKNPLYEVGLKRNKIYETLWDDIACFEIYKEHEVITVLDDDGQGHEIEFGDYEVKEWY